MASSSQVASTIMCSSFSSYFSKFIIAIASFISFLDARLSSDLLSTEITNAIPFWP